jgi:hypothetical protein
VRRRVAAERDQLGVARLRIEPAEMAAALRAEPDATIGRRRDVVDAGALARRERPAAHRRSVGTRGERPHGQESGAGEGGDCVASRADRHGGLLRERMLGIGTLYSRHAACRLQAFLARAAARPDCGSRRRRAARGQDDDLLHVRVPLRHPRPPARRRAALHRRQPEPSAQQGCDLRQGLGGDHEAALAGAPHAAAAAQGRQRARRRRLRGDLVGSCARDPDDAAGEDPRQRPEASSRSSPAATRCRR